MLDDRSYMRGNEGSGMWGWLAMPASILLIISLVVAFVFQEINAVYLHFPVERYLMLSLDGLKHGYVWELVTFQFLHEGLLHLLFNALGIWFFGRFVESRLGKWHFTKLYFLSGIAGGLLQSAMAWAFPSHFTGAVVGASAGVLALLAAFALIEPEANILLFFVVPVPAKYLLYGELIIAAFFTIVPSDPEVAHAAHLGGTLFAMAYMRWGLNMSRSLSEWNPLQRKMRRERMIKAATVRAPAGRVRRRSPEEEGEVPSEEFISKQVDPILDKISAQGIQSLTPRERDILQAARNRMSKR